MEKSSHIDLPIKGIICTLKFSYIFLARNLCVTFDAVVLADYVLILIAATEKSRGQQFGTGY